MRGRSWCGLLAVGLGLAVCGPARAADRSARDPAQERAYEAELASVDPKLPEAFAAATRLMDQGHPAEAEAAFRKIAEAAPGHAPTLWRLSTLARIAGHRDEAITRARAAVAAGGRWQAKGTLAEALMYESHDRSDLDEADTLLYQARHEHQDEYLSLTSALLAVKRNDVAGLRAAIDDLQSMAPGSIGTDYFQFTLAVYEERWDAADAFLSQAVAHGMPAAEAADLREKSGVAAHMATTRWVKIGAVALVVWLGGLFLIFVLGMTMSRQTLAAVQRFDGKDRDAFARTTRRFRSSYGALIGLAAVYYYISVPIVIAAVVALAGAIIYGFMMLGRIPIKLLLIVGVVAIVSVWSMLRSLVVRRGADEDPGRPLTEAEAPALWELLREVARRVGTRPVDAVYMTLATEVAVIERGSVRKRVRDEGKRSLILGVGALEGMTRQQLRAILAHEYGHFSNRDTAGGRLPAVVQSSLFASMVRIARGGGATFYNPAWHFVRGFHALFLRITLGASRLREIMADQLAAVAYGGQAFAAGLRHIVRRSLEFDRNLDVLASRAQAEARPIASLYATPAAAAGGEADLEARFNERMRDAGSPYDSHPPPGARIDWVGRIGVATDPPPADADQPAWSLFANRAALEGEMTALANSRLAAMGAFANAPRPAAPSPSPSPAP
ncbi:MAG TPA: M48 family metalloprotease [Polyangia bacterium]|nr:M48 family metalloprotease [Polyangia bacterium]